MYTYKMQWCVLYIHKETVMEALAVRSFEIAEYIGNRWDFFRNTWEGTRIAYNNKEENTWFKDAVRDRIIDSKGIICAYVRGELAGYVAYDVYHVFGIGKVLYIDIATCFVEYARQGVVSRLLRSFQGYDAYMLRTQNPNMADSMYQAYGECEPITGYSEEGRKVAEVLGKSWHDYNADTMVCRGIYNHACLTGEEIHGRHWFDRELYSRINPSHGDAIILVAFCTERLPQGRF